MSCSALQLIDWLPRLHGTSCPLTSTSLISWPTSLWLIEIGYLHDFLMVQKWEKGPIDNQPPAFSSKPKSWKFKFPAEFYEPSTKVKAPSRRDPESLLELSGTTLFLLAQTHVASQRPLPSHPSRGRIILLPAQFP